MSKPFKINEELSIYVINDQNDSLLSNTFFNNLYNNVFSNEKNNLIAGLTDMNSVEEVREQIIKWLPYGNFSYMFFLFKGKDVIGSTQVFRPHMFEPNTLSLGYIVSPFHQGKGYGTIMLKFVSEYLYGVGFTNIVLGVRDGNSASERIAAKNNYSYFIRTNVPDAFGSNRPMTFYKYNGKTTINEGYAIIPKSKILVTNQWFEDKSVILSRVNPKMLNLEEYVYLSTSINKPILLNETYFLFSSPHYNLSDRLKKEKIKSKYFALTDIASKNIFDPVSKGDIALNEFCDLVDSDLQILQISDDKTSMILGNDRGEIRVSVANDKLMVEEYVLNNK